MTNVELYNRLYDELVASGLLAAGAPRPSNRHHDHITMLVMSCSWVGDRWVRDPEPPQPAPTA